MTPGEAICGYIDAPCPLKGNKALCDQQPAVACRTKRQHNLNRQNEPGQPPEKGEAT